MTRGGGRDRLLTGAPAPAQCGQFRRPGRDASDLVRRWVSLGLLEPTRDATGQLWFAAPQLRAVARIQRLRAGLSVNYAALGLVMDLLDRIERSRPRCAPPALPCQVTKERSWAVNSLQQLTTAHDILLNDLIDRYRNIHSGDVTVPPCAKDWGRKGNTHFKDNKWFKNSDPPKKGK